MNDEAICCVDCIDDRSCRHYIATDWWVWISLD